MKMVLSQKLPKLTKTILKKEIRVTGFYLYEQHYIKFEKFSLYIFLNNWTIE